MSFKLRSRTHTTHTLEAFGAEVELELKPYSDDDIIGEKVAPDTIVIAYLVQDECPSNPLTDFDCQGKLYTRNEGVITDDRATLMAELGVSHHYETPDIDVAFEVGPYIDAFGLRRTHASLRDMAAAEMFNRIEADLPGMFLPWVKDRDDDLDIVENLEAEFEVYRTELLRDLGDIHGFYCDEVETLANDMFPDYWQAIAGPYVVPMYYRSGRGETRIYPSAWDGDIDDLPNCIWVADENCIDNMTPLPQGIAIELVERVPNGYAYYAVADGQEIVARFEIDEPPAYNAYLQAKAYAFRQYGHRPVDVRAAAERYAKEVAKEYAAWCSGDVYGCVSQVFRRQEDGAWLSDAHDSCWGFIGHSYAEQALRDEFFTPALNHEMSLLKETT